MPVAHRIANRWPIFIVALLLLFLAFTGWSMQRAAAEVSAVSDPAYYRHGLHYAVGQVEEKAMLALGWRMTPELAAGELRFFLVAAGEAPLVGGTGELLLFSADHGGLSPRPIPLRETGDGHYAATLPAALRGNLTAELSFRQGTASLHRRLVFRL